MTEGDPASRRFSRLAWLQEEEGLVLLQLEHLAAGLATCQGAPDPIGPAVADRVPGALRRVLQQLRALSGGGAAPELAQELAERRELLALSEHPQSPWAQLQARLALSEVDIDLLRLLVILATSPVASRLAAALGADPSRLGLLEHGIPLDFLTTCLCASPGDKVRLRRATHPEHPLPRYRLVELRHDLGLWPRLRASEALIAWVLEGAVPADPCLVHELRPAPRVPPQRLAPEPVWSRLEQALAAPAPRLLLLAPPGGALDTLTAGLASLAGRPLIACDVPAESPGLAVSAAVRDAVLLDAWLALTLPASAREEPRPGESLAHRSLAALLAEAPVPISLAAASQTGLAGALGQGFEPITLPELEPEQLAALWVTASPGGARGPAGAATALIAEVMRDHRLRPAAVLEAAVDAVARAGREGRRALSRADIVEACAARATAAIGSLAVRQRGTFTWDDLIVPEETADLLAEILTAASHRGKVMDTWGFGLKYPYGSCPSVLFSGPSGTGKTMAATLLAEALGRPLYRVDLSQIVDRYVGETEKNLSRIFDAAEAAHAVLLFDEADALFSRRTEVTSSNDRYANLEVNHLLQRVEHHRGVVILTTNLDASIDEAFRRRIRFSVRFPVPDAATRATLWRSMIPPAADLGKDVDFAQLGQAYDLPGGGIKNAVLRSAYLAARDGGAIAMSHLERAARAECMALGKLVRAL